MVQLQGKEILKAVMLQSKTVLTDVFRVAVHDLGSFHEFTFADWLPALQGISSWMAVKSTI